MKNHMLVAAGPFLLACFVATAALAQGEPAPAGPTATAASQPAAPAVPAAAGTTAAECTARKAPAPALAAPAAGSLAHAQSALALKLLATQQGRGADPLALSPAGIASVLGALELGADPAMRAAILKTLQLKGDGKAAAAEDLRRSLRLMAAGPADTTLSSASVLFVDLRQPLKPGIAERVVAEAQMPLRLADLATPAGIGEVNAFVSDRTRGRIPAILGEGDTGAALVAVNAFHFLGCWQVPFNPRDTRPAAFTTLDGKKVEVPTMSLGEAVLSHRLEGRFAAVDLAYDDPRYSLVLVTTVDKPVGAADFAPAQKLLEAEAFTQERVALTLPRFRIEAATDVLPVLSGLGLEAGLKSPTVLSGFADGLKLGAVQQKVFISATSGAPRRQRPPRRWGHAAWL